MFVFGNDYQSKITCFEMIIIKGMNLLHFDKIAEGRYLQPAMMAELPLCSQHQFANAEFLLLENQTKTQSQQYFILVSLL